VSNTPEKQVHDKIVSNVTDRGKEGTVEVFDEVFDRLEKLEKAQQKVIKKK